MNYLPIVILCTALSISGFILLYAGFRTKKQLDLTDEYLEALDDYIRERLASLEKQLNRGTISIHPYSPCGIEVEENIKSSLPEDDDSEEDDDSDYEDDWEDDDDSITEEDGEDDEDEDDSIIEDEYEEELEDDDDEDDRLLSEEPLGTLCIDCENDLIWSTDGITTKVITHYGRPVIFSLGPNAIHVVKKATPEDIQHYLDLVIERYGKIA